MSHTTSQLKEESLNLEELLNQLLIIAQKYDGCVATPVKEVILKNPDCSDGRRRIYIRLK